VFRRAKDAFKHFDEQDFRRLRPDFVQPKKKSAYEWIKVEFPDEPSHANVDCYHKIDKVAGYELIPLFPPRYFDSGRWSKLNAVDQVAEIQRSSRVFRLFRRVAVKWSNGVLSVALCLSRCVSHTSPAHKKPLLFFQTRASLV